MELLNIDEIISACEGSVLNYEADIKIKGISIDSRKIKVDDMFIALKGENFGGHEFVKKAVNSGAKLVLVEEEIKDIECPCIIVENTIAAMHKLAKYYKSKFNIPFVALTGSSGKTTTKEMIWSVLSQKFNTLKTEGNYNNAIGLPLTLFNLTSAHEIAVLEMGMNSLGEIRALADIVRPDVSIITNVGTAHIEKLGSRANILKAKCEIFSYFDKESTAIINGDNDLLKTLMNDKYKIIKFGIEKGNDYIAININDNTQMGVEFDILISGNEEHFIIPLPGIHNVYNGLSAIAVGIHFGVEIEKIKKGLLAFKPAKMRMNIFDTEDELKVIDDVYNANPDSMLAAVNVLLKQEVGRRKVAILGNMLELGDTSGKAHYDLGKYAANAGVDILIAVGDMAKEIAQGAKDFGMGQDSIFHYLSNQETTLRLPEILKANDIILIKGSRGAKMEYIVDFIREGIKNV